MILRICSLILPASKREMFDEAWAADFSSTNAHSLARFWLGLQFLVASIKIRAFNDSTQLLKIFGLVLVSIPIALAYIQFATLRELIIGLLFLTAYRLRNLTSVWVNRALLASATQMFIAASFAWSRGLLVRDSSSFNSFWQSFGLLPAWVPIGLGLLTLVSAGLALGLWIWAATKSRNLSLIEKSLFAATLLAGFPQLLWEVSDSIRLIGGDFLPDQVVVAISRLQNESTDLMLIFAQAGLAVWLVRQLINRLRSNRGQYRSPRTTSTSESQTVDA